MSGYWSRFKHVAYSFYVKTIGSGRTDIFKNAFEK